MTKKPLIFVLLSLTTAVGQAKPHAPLSQQKMCDVEARKAFNKSWSPEKDGMSHEYTSHYDPKLNVCYVLIHGDGTIKGNPVVSYLLLDAIEGREYGNYFWTNSQNKKFWEVAPMFCTVKPRDDDPVTCHSDDEFERLIDKYFGIGR